MEPRISIITLGVKDLKKSTAFYEKGLGFPLSSVSSKTIAFFQLGPMALALYPKTLLAEDATVSAEGGGFSGLTIAHNTSSPTEVEAILAKAEQAGAKIVKPGQKADWGGYSGYFSDPDGHLWEIAHNPFFELKADGSLVLAIE